MVFEKTDEWKKVTGYRDNTIKYVTSLIIIGLISAGLLIDHRWAMAGLLIVLAFLAHKFTTIISKMDLFKHAPNAIQYTVIKHTPLTFLVCAIAVSLLG